MFLAKNRVRMHDIDMAGVLYFPRQFRFVHDTFEDFMQHTGLTFDKLFRKEHFVFVVVHAEADYLKPLHVGDDLEVDLRIENIGNTSFTVGYKIFKSDKTLAGTAKTVHVTLDAKTREKIRVPDSFRKFLSEYLHKS